MVSGAFHFVETNPADSNHWTPDLRFGVARMGRLCSNTLPSSALVCVLVRVCGHALRVCCGSLAVAQPHRVHAPPLHVSQYTGCLNLPLARVATDNSHPLSSLAMFHLAAPMIQESCGSTADVWFTWALVAGGGAERSLSARSCAKE